MVFLPGLNIQWPISQEIISGKKTVETRTYPIPAKYIGVDILLIETPGPSGDFKARAAGILRFEESFQYKNKKEFYLDKRHLVTEDSDWSWKKKKWGWPIASFTPFEKTFVIKTARGIVFTQKIKLPPSLPPVLRRSDSLSR